MTKAARICILNKEKRKTLSADEPVTLGHSIKKVIDFFEQLPLMRNKMSHLSCEYDSNFAENS